MKPLTDNDLIALAVIAAFWAAVWWWERQGERHASFDARWPHGTGRAALRHWIEAHMPELDAELGPLSMDQVRMRLNEVTGCSVQGNDSVEEGSAVFLAALRAQHASSDPMPPASGHCPISGLPYAWMREQWEKRQHVRQQSKETP